MLVSTSSSPFLMALIPELMKSMTHWYGSENFDYETPAIYESTFKSRIGSKINELFAGRIAILPVNNEDLVKNVSRIKDSIDGLGYVYDLLADEYSKSILVKVLTYRIMGHRKVKLPLNTKSYWSQRENLRSLIKGKDTVKIKFLNWELNHYALDQIGYPIELFFLPGGVMITFILQQYAYRKRNPEIKAPEGGYVIDGGGCWGDTALYFAHQVGEKGKVYTFEFTPDNLEVLQRNFDLNPELSKRIEVVPKALWEKSGEVISYYADGPATSVALREKSERDALNVSTMSIDDIVKEKKMPRVDFIKMDIEGAELGALKGAEQTLRTFKPKLAIAIYHQDQDMIEIPTYLEELDLGYEFFLDHFTIYGAETVLFASPKIN